METKELLHLRLLADPKYIPDDKGDGKQFWDIVESFAFKDAALLLLVGAVPQKDIAEMNDNECRSHLAVLQSFHKLLHVPAYLRGLKVGEKPITPNAGSDLDGEQDKSKETLTED